MIVKTFTGSSLRDALQRVRESFGADAVIIDTQFDGHARGAIGPGSGRVSVTAACEPESGPSEIAETPADTVEGPKTLHVKGDLLETGEKGPREFDEPRPPARSGADSARAVNADEGGIEGVTRILTELTRDIQTRQAADELWPAVRRWLAGQPELMSSIADSFAADSVDSLPPIEPFLNIRPKGQNVLLLGERGVGKSTAMFKAFAARWKICKRKPYLRIISESIDHGQERLQALCSRCDVAVATDAFENGRLRFSERRIKGDSLAEFVCGPPNADVEAHAKAIRRRFHPNVVALVLNATGTPRAWDTAYERFLPFSPTHVVFTHWDECRPWWEVAAFARYHTLLLSYHTQGFEPFGEITPFMTSDLRTGIADFITESVGGETPSEGRFRSYSRQSIIKPAISADNSG